MIFSDPFYVEHLMNPESRTQNLRQPPKKKYVAPSLVIYGAVRNLTQSGSGRQIESDPLPWNSGCWPDANRKPCSERRVKENIARIGDHPLGFNLYLFDYRPEFRAKWGHGRQFGVMIDEVERVMPEAVSLHSDGFKRVDYALLGIERPLH